MTGANKVKNFKIPKSIRLTERQAEIWNPTKIKDFLDAKLDKNELFYENIIKKFIPVFLNKKIDIDFTNEEFDLIERLYTEISKEKGYIEHI